MQFFEFLTQIHRQKLNFEPRFEKKFILKLEQQRLLSIWSCRLSENYFLNGYLCFFVFLYANEKSQIQFAVIGTKNALPHHPNVSALRVISPDDKLVIAGQLRAIWKYFPRSLYFLYCTRLRLPCNMRVIKRTGKIFLILHSASFDNYYLFHK